LLLQPSQHERQGYPNNANANAIIRADCQLEAARECLTDTLLEPWSLLILARALPGIVVYVSLQTLFDLYALRRHLHSNPSELKDVQTKRLRAIMNQAYANVPFYHRKFDEARVRPDDIKNVEDLTRIPMSTRNEIQAAPLSEITAKNIDIDKCARRTTSGSTGIPLTVTINPRAEQFEEALWTRAYLENGLRIRDKMSVIHDPRSIKASRRNDVLQKIGLMRRQYISIFDTAEKQSKLIEKYNPHAIKGYASSLAILADFIKRQSSPIHPRQIFSGAELLDNQTRKSISSIFEAEIFDNYACNEFTLMAWECRQHEGYHINVENVIMEFVADDETAAPGERGEIVCTGLTNYAMPLIRYRLGDIGIPNEEQCSCGRTLPLMKVVEGRADDFLITTDGRLISPLVFFPYPFKEGETRQFRVIQEKRDKLIIQLVLQEGVRGEREIFEHARKEISRLFGTATRVEFQTLDKIEKDPSGKLRKIISHVAINGHMGKASH
jgi:phenylacetate-CoA ligase